MITNQTINIVKSLIASTLMAAMPTAGYTYASSPSVAQLPPPPPPLPVPVPAPFPVPLQPAIQTSEAYTLGAGDRIQIDIFNVPEYSGPNGQHQILADGTLSLPLIGNLGVQGMTLEQAADEIKQRYGKYLRRPVITLKLLAPRPLQIAIAGEVHRPGSYTVSPSSGPGGFAEQVGTQLPTVTRALKMAGGITPSADVRQIKIRRPQRGGPEQIINVNLWELLQSGDLRSDITLRDGDAIYIPTVTDINREENRTLANANFSSESNEAINIAVVGEVARPGTYTLGRDIQTNQITAIEANGNQTLLSSNEPPPDTSGPSTVTKAIKLAGGITQQADIRQIQVRRITRAGTEQTISVNLWELLQAGDITQDVMLQQGDTIIVPKADNTNSIENAEVGNSSFSPDTINISIVGEAIRPGAIAVPPSTSLNQALLAAGGFNKARADMSSVELIRLNPNGTVSRRTISINFEAAVNEETNPLLRSNDVIMVKRSGRAAFSDRVGGTIAPLSPFLGILRVFDLFR